MATRPRPFWRRHSYKSKDLLPIATNNGQMKFEIKIPKEIKIMLRKPCRQQMDEQTHNVHIDT